MRRRGKEGLSCGLLAALIVSLLTACVGDSSVGDGGADAGKSDSGVDANGDAGCRPCIAGQATFGCCLQ